MTRLGARATAVGTVAQVVPQLWRVLSHLRPTWHLRSLAALDAAFVARHSISAIIWDVDGTLTVNHADRLADESRAPFIALQALPGLSHSILSNAGQVRFLQLTQIFSDIPVHQGVSVNGAVVLRTRCGTHESWSGKEPVGRFTAAAIPLRKPNAELIRRVIEVIGRPAEEVVMVGDQYFTDIAGAGMAEIRSIKLPTVAPRAFPRSIQVAQQLERLVYRMGYGAPQWEG
jgi:predicted HAD superfamily phosphohydrolase YqeG